MSTNNTSYFGRIITWMNPQNSNDIPQNNRAPSESSSEIFARRSNDSNSTPIISDNSSRRSSIISFSNLFRSNSSKNSKSIASNASLDRPESIAENSSDTSSVLSFHTAKSNPTSFDGSSHTSSDDESFYYSINESSESVESLHDATTTINKTNRQVSEQELRPYYDQATVDELEAALRNSREGNYGIDTIHKDLIPEEYNEEFFALREMTGNDFRKLSIGLTLEAMLNPAALNSDDEPRVLTAPEPNIFSEKNIHRGNTSRSQVPSIASTIITPTNSDGEDDIRPSSSNNDDQSNTHIHSTSLISDPLHEPRISGKLKLEIDTYPSIAEELKPTALREINESLSNATPEIKATALEQLLNSIHPLKLINKNDSRQEKKEKKDHNEQTITTQRRILAMVDEHTKSMTITPDGNLNEGDKRVLTALASNMHKLHAAHLGDSIRQFGSYKFKLVEEHDRDASLLERVKNLKFNPALRNPQMDAAKILKRRQEALLKVSPKAAVALVNNVTDNCKINELSTNLRALSDSHVIQMTTSAVITGALYATSVLVVGPAISDAFHVNAETPSHPPSSTGADLQLAHDHITNLNDTLSAQNNGVAQAASDANNFFNTTVKPGSETCEATWYLLHPDGVHTEHLYDIVNWRDAAQQLDLINSTGMSAQTQTAIEALKEKTHAIVAAMDSRDATLTALQEWQALIPGLEKAVADEATNLANENTLFANNAAAATAQLRQVITAIAAPIAAEVAAAATNKAVTTIRSSSTSDKPPVTESTVNAPVIAHVKAPKKKYIGKIGAIGIAYEGIQIVRKQKLSSVQHATIRQQITTLKEAGKTKDASNIAPLGEAWSSMLGLIKSQPENTNVSDNTSPNADTSIPQKNLSIAEQAYILDAAIKELGKNSAIQTQNAHQKAIRESINKIKKPALNAILKHLAKPEIFPSNNALPKLHGSPKHASSYLWLADYLLTSYKDDTIESGPDIDSSAIRARDIVITLEKIAGPFGSANYLRAQKLILKSKQALLHIRPTLQFTGKSKGEGKKQLREQLHAKSDYLDSKLARVAEAGRNFENGKNQHYWSPPKTISVGKKLAKLDPKPINSSLKS